MEGKLKKMKRDWILYLFLLPSIIYFGSMSSVGVGC